jgi:hypothetical protein
MERPRSFEEAFPPRSAAPAKATKFVKLSGWQPTRESRCAAWTTSVLAP